MISRNGMSLRGRLAAIAGLTLFLVLAGTAIASAVWTAATSTTGTVSAAATSLTIAGTNSLTTQYKFAGAASNSPTIVRTTVVANTGTAPLSYTLSVSGVTGNALAPQVTLTLWTMAGTCLAGPGAGSTTGTLAVPPPLPSAALSAAPGVIFTLCASTRLNSTIPASQGMSVTPTLTITGTVGSNWTASTSDAAFTQSVYQMINPSSLVCAQGPGKRATLSWTAPINTGSTGAVTYRVVDAANNSIVLVPFQSATTATIYAANLNGATENLLVQAKEGLYGSTSVGIPITLGQTGGPSSSVTCP